MMVKTPTRFDFETLRELAGDKVFARGKDYYRDGTVEILAIDRRRVLARVEGTDDYRTEITGRGTEIGGECSCPAFGDWGFCKHMVATALAANAAGGGAETEGADPLSRVRDHLRAKSVDALVQIIVELAERDPALFHKLSIAATVEYADDKTLEAQLRKAIDGATRVRDFVDYRHAAGWAADVGAALDMLAGLASGKRAALVLASADRAMDRIERAIGSIDDSDGHCGALLDRARDIHIAAARAAQPEPVRFARDLFAREMKDEYGTPAAIGSLYADVLGERGLAEYRRLALEAWEKLPAPKGKARAGDDFSDGRYRLTRILDFFAERDGDIDARIALRAKTLSSPWSYLQLAEFCAAQGRQAEALRRAEEGLWVFEDEKPDERLVLFVAALLSKAGRREDAAAHLWRAFEKAPSLELYAQLRKLGGKTEYGRAAKILESPAGDEARKVRYSADLLVDIQIREKMFDAAWATVRRGGVSMSVREELARKSESVRPREAIETYALCVEQLAGAGGNPAYARAAALIARMATLRDAAEQAAYVAALKARFERKRNFVKLLG